MNNQNSLSNLNIPWPEWLNQVFLGLPVTKILEVVVVFLFCFLGLYLLRQVIFILLGHSEDRKNHILRAFLGFLEKINDLYFLLLAAYFSLLILQIESIWRPIVATGLILLSVWHASGLARNFINTLFEARYQQQKHKNAQAQFDASVAQLLGLLSTIGCWLLGFGAILHLFNINPSVLASTLGVSGVIIAFALQNVLADLFASLSIYFDRPFTVGDYIIIGADSGTVQRIGLKSTRLRTITGEELVVSNKELTQVRVRNYKKMLRRSVLFTVLVDKETENEKLRNLPKMLEDIITKINICEYERSHFKEFSDKGLVFEVVYHIKSPDHNTYMDIAQKINLEIKEKCEQEEIKLSY